MLPRWTTPLALVLVGGALASATDWHVSVTGDDGNSGTAAAPFRTIQKAATLAVAGDTVWIAPGTYRETVRPANSGTADRRIVFAGVAASGGLGGPAEAGTPTGLGGPAEAGTPTVSGADVVAGPWTRVGGSDVYWASWIGDYTSLVNQSDQVFAGGRMLNLLRWPKETNGDLTLPREAAIDSISWSVPQATVTESEWDQPDGRWAGAKVWVNLSNERDGQGQTGTIVGTNLAARQITWAGIDTKGAYSAIGPWVVRAGTAYYLFDPTPAGLAATGGVEAALGENEWWLDRTTRRLYVRLAGGADPASLVIEARRRDFAFNLMDRSHITVRGMALFAAGITSDPNPGTGSAGSAVAAATGILLDDLDVQYVGHFIDQSGDYQIQWGAQSGIILSGTGHVLRNSRFRLSAGPAVSAMGRGHRIYNNLFEDIGYSVTEAGVINTGKWSSIAQDFKIAYNTVRRSAGLGISIRMLRNSDPERVGLARVHHNHIHDIMLRVTDSGGIDTAYTDGRWTRIDHNLIHGLNQFLHFGIYPDFGAGEKQMRYLIDHNVVFDTWSPIGGNGFHTITIFNNVAIASPHPSYSPGGISTVNGSRENIGVIIRNNISNGSLFGLDNAQKASNITQSAAALNSLFVDSLNGNLLFRDYALKPSASAAIDKGAPTPPWDDPVAGAAPDIGAYEYGRAKWQAGYGAVPWYLDDHDTLRVAARAATSRGAVVLHAFAGNFPVNNVSVSGASTGLEVTPAGDSIGPDGSLEIAITASTNAPVGSGWFEIEGTLDGAVHRQVFTIEVLPAQQVGSVAFTGASADAWIFGPGSGHQLTVVAYDTGGKPLVGDPLVEWFISGGGAIDEAGRLTTAAQQGGPYVLSATVGGVSAIQAFNVWRDWARAGSVSASSTLSGSTPASNAVDASLSTFWVSQPSDPQWLQVDMGEPVALERVDLVWNTSNYATRYAIEVSDDGAAWTRIFEVSGLTTGTARSHRDLDAPLARHVRVLGLARPGTSARYGVADLRVYGLRASDAPAVARTLVVNAAPGGAVAAEPDKAVFADGEWVRLTAQADASHVFTGWAGDAAGSSNPLWIQMDRDRSVQAQFAGKGTVWELTVTASNGTVSRDPEKSVYLNGEMVTLAATPDSGYRFKGWSGDASGSDPVTTVVMSSDRTVNALFELIPAQRTLVVEAVNGTVSRVPDKATYDEGESVALTAVPADGYRFVEWGRAASGISPALTVTVATDMTVTARFARVHPVPEDPRVAGPVLAGATGSAPVIDGLVDPVWWGAPLLPIALPVNLGAGAELPDPANLSGNWSALWDDTALYLLVDVTDDVVQLYTAAQGDSPAWYADDSVEIYLDPDHSRGPVYDGVNDLQIGIRALDDPAVLFYGPNSVRALAGAAAAVALHPSGYVLEVALPWASLGVAPAAQAVIGIDVAINDGDRKAGAWPATRLGWVSTNNEAYLDPSEFGGLPLSDRWIPEGFWIDHPSLGWIFGYGGDWAWGANTGFVHLAAYPWVYQTVHGWMQVAVKGRGFAFLHSPGLGWLYMPHGYGGFFYRYDTATWMNFLQ